VAPIFQCTSSADGRRDVYDSTADRCIGRAYAGLADLLMSPGIWWRQHPDAIHPQRIAQLVHPGAHISMPRYREQHTDDDAQEHQRKEHPSWCTFDAGLLHVLAQVDVIRAQALKLALLLCRFGRGLTGDWL
jgi:hypothetical protein